MAVIDHMFDKILHIKLPSEISNSYLEKLYQSGHQYVINYINKHSISGYINAKEDLLECVKKMEQDKREKIESYQNFFV